MNTKKLLFETFDNLKLIFTGKNVQAKIVMFVITGFMPLILFVINFFYLYFLDMILIFDRDTDKVINNEKIDSLAKAVILIIISPKLIFKYICLPALYVGFYFSLNLYNWATQLSTLFEAKWITIY